MQVTISATSIGGNAGPFAIYQNFDSYATPVATGITRASILAGYVVTVNDATTTVRLISSGTCTNSTDISVIYPSPTPTPTTTPTPTPSPVRILYYAGDVSGCTGRTLQFTKNAGDLCTGQVCDGSVTLTVGDTISVSDTTGPKATGLCTNATVGISNTTFGNTELGGDSQTGQGVSAFTTYTITSGSPMVIYMWGGLSI